MSGYDRDDLSDDLTLMVACGLLDISMREDGEWLYNISEKAQAMTEEERELALEEMLRNHRESQAGLDL